MPLPNTFATVATGAQEPGSALDQNFAALGALITLACTATGTNAITLTPFVNTPTVSAYANFLRFAFNTAATSTGAVTIGVSALAALPFYFPDGVTQVGAGALPLGQYVETSYNSLLNSGAGGFVWLNPTSGASGAAYVLLGTATASNTARVAFTTGITSSYDNYEIRFTNVVPVTNGSTYSVQVSENAGSTWISTTNYQLANWVVSTAPAGSAVGSTSSGAMSLCTVDNTANFGVTGQLSFANPGGTTNLKMFRWQYLTLTGGVIYTLTGGGFYGGDTGAINGVSFLQSAGNISSGFFALYGVRKQ